MKRKIISVMLTGTMIAGMLTGCGSDSSSKQTKVMIRHQSHLNISMQTAKMEIGIIR